MAEEAKDEKIVCSDPCQIPVVNPVTKEKRICGVVMKSLTSHLRVHNKGLSKAKKWNSKRYREVFPDFSMGQPPNNSPDPEQVQKWAAARDKVNADRKAARELLADPKLSDKKTDSKVADEYLDGVQARFEELWDQVNRDLPARQFAMEAARAEQRIEEINRRYDSAFARGDYKRMTDLTKELQTQHKTLKDCMDFLDLTVKNRREKNQLGNDTVAQLISNYGATLRRFSPEKRQAFNNRVAEVRRIMEETRRQKLLSEALDEKIEDIVPQRQMSEEDYEREINSIVAGADL